MVAMHISLCTFIATGRFFYVVTCNVLTVQGTKVHVHVHTALLYDSNRVCHKAMKHYFGSIYGSRAD